MGVDVSSQAEMDALFSLPLDGFTAARNALAAQLKKAGREVDADYVKRLPKPPVSAWTVNQLYWCHREAFDRLLAAGERFRKAQAAQLAGHPTNIREPLAAHRDALADLSRHAATTLREAGHLPTPNMMRRVTMTLEALSTFGSSADTPAAGRLTKDIDPPGFETLAALVPRAGHIVRAGSRSNRLLSFQRETRHAKPHAIDKDERRRQQDEERRMLRVAAKAQLQEAERGLRAARKAAEQAERELKQAAARAKEAEKEKTEAEVLFEKASASAEATRQEARRVAAEAEGAAQAVEDAERALEKARRDLGMLDE